MTDMIRSAHVSGDLGQAVFSTADGTWLLDKSGRHDPGPNDLAFFFQHALEIEAIAPGELKALSVEALSDRLARAAARSDLLHDLLVGMDASLPRKLRAEAIGDAGKALASPLDRDWAARHFLKTVDTPEWDPAEAVKIARRTDAGAIVIEFYEVAASPQLGQIEAHILRWAEGDQSELDRARDAGVVAEIALACHRASARGFDSALARAALGFAALVPGLAREFRVVSPARPVGEERPAYGWPANVDELMIQGRVTPTWDLENRTHNRFYLLNVRPVMAEIGVDESRYAEFFEMAPRLIRERGWDERYRFVYSSSYTHISRKNYSKAKRFGHAVTCIVALEAAAKAFRSSLNVYDQLRILSAQFFVDGFTPEVLSSLQKEFIAIPRSERRQISRFADDAQFEEAVLDAIDQTNSYGLLSQMAHGYCATRHVCERLVEFINGHFAGRGSRNRVGPVLEAGNPDARDDRLGTKNAAVSLRVPKVWDPETFPIVKSWIEDPAGGSSSRSAG